MDQNIKDLLEQLFEAHQKPIVKLNIGGVKIYIPKEADKDKEAVDRNLGILKDALSFPRVEKRNVRSQGEFLQPEGVVKVTKIHNLKNLGYGDKSGKYLHLEEALFLLECNRLEILWNNVPMSIRQAYNLFLNEKLPLNRYRIYKKLRSEGFKVQRPTSIVKEPPLKKIKLNDFDDSISKIEIETKVSSNSKEIEQEKNYNAENCTRKDLENKRKERIAEFFKKLKDRAPKILNDRIEKDVAFSCSSSKKSDGVKYDVHLIRGEMDPKIGFYEENNSNLFGLIFDDGIPFYKISRISLPNLLEENNK